LKFSDRFELELVWKDPKDGELCLLREKPGENLVEARSDADVQIDSSEMSIAAKDQSSYLVAGSFRSFTQDSWSNINQFHLVKRMIRGLGIETVLTYSQTLNG